MIECTLVSKESSDLVMKGRRSTFYFTRDCDIFMCNRFVEYDKGCTAEPTNLWAVTLHTQINALA